MRPIRSVSVLMPTWQGMEFLDRVLHALSTQRVDVSWDFRAIDSGSTDGTWELLGEWAERFPVPLHRERIHQVEFDHGDTRNLLAARSRGDLLVFLTQDAIPASDDWLATLLANFEDDAVGAAYCRNAPRPDALVTTQVLSAGDPGYALEPRRVELPEPDVYEAMSAHERRLLYNFNDVASAVRRELWERHPFPRAAFGEDVLMARALLEAGSVVVYDAEAVVEHSHDYDEQETYSRAFTDGRFNAEWLDRICVGSERDAEALVEQLSRDDAKSVGAAATELGLDPQRERALLEAVGRLRRAAFLGLCAGGRSARRHEPTRLREDGCLSLLYVVHGFPPDTWAGTEVYTLNIAREMAGRGHEVTILTRSPAMEDSEEDFTLVEDRFEELRVIRLVHRLDHQRLSDSYDQPRAEAAFRRLLASESFDLVHFQHLIHTSIGLVEAAREQGLATVITCHDYWALCARVQLIRPDGEICSGNMGSGCFACVKETGLEHVPRASRLDQAASDLLVGYAEALAREGGEGTSRRAQEYLDLRAREQKVPAAYAACDLRISPSRFLRELYLSSGHFDPHTFLFSDNGMRTDHVQALRKTPSPDGRVRFGFVGSLVWYKGGETLIRAMRELVDVPVELHVHGGFDPEGDPHHAELQALAEGAGVQFHGRFDNARLSEVYADIDVLVVPSVWFENSPITIHEAFLTGTPVLASDIGGMAEFVTDGVDGLHFRVGDALDLAAKMRRFVEEPQLLEELSREFPPVKTITENAEELEFRYRALCCRVRPEPGQLLAISGPDVSRRTGPVEEQGPWLLLRPGGEVEVDVAGLPRGPVVLEVALRLFGAEGEVEHGGQVLVGGREAGLLATVASKGEDGDHTHELSFDLEPGDAVLRISTLRSAGGEACHLRLAGLRLSRAEGTRA